MIVLVVHVLFCLAGAMGVLFDVSGLSLDSPSVNDEIGSDRYKTRPGLGVQYIEQSDKRLETKYGIFTNEVDRVGGGYYLRQATDTEISVMRKTYTQTARTMGDIAMIVGAIDYASFALPPLLETGASAWMRFRGVTTSIESTSIELSSGKNFVYTPAEFKGSIQQVGRGLNEASSSISAEATMVGKPATGWPGTGGSGPVPGTIAITNETSVGALRNYSPKGGGVEFVYDPVTNTFVTGRPANGLFQGSPHQQLAQSINAEDRLIVGGTLQRGAKGEFFTTENSGHYGQNWTNLNRQQFQDWLSSRLKVPVKHQPWNDQ